MDRDIRAVPAVGHAVRSRLRMPTSGGKGTRLLTLAVCAFGLLGSMRAARAQTAPAAPKSRVIVLTDIGADPDDTESLVRLLLYSNELELEGLIATTSTWQQTRASP